MKKTALLATSAVVAAGFAASAMAVDVEMYGQVNKGFIVADDGEATKSAVVDNDVSSTRFGVKGSQVLDNGLTASVLMEFEMQGEASNAVSQGREGLTDAAGAAANFTERHSRVGLAGDFGAVFLGHTSSATDSVAEQDLVGVSDVMISSITYIGGGLEFQNGTGAPTVAQNFTNMDGNGRTEVVRYDSPIWNGVQVRTSLANGGDADLGVYYTGKVDAFEIKGAVGYVANNGIAAAPAVGASSVESQISGSVSVKHDSGVAATVAYGQQSIENKAAGEEDPTFLYVKAGYAWSAFEVAAEYATFEGQNKNELTEYGVGAQYNMGSGVSVAAFAKQFDLDLAPAASVDPDEINLYGVNMRVKF